MTANLRALKALVPEAFNEGTVDFEVLRQVLGDAVDDGDERYGLNWPGKRQARRLGLTPSMGTLRPAREDSLDWDATRNLVIEGDNLEALKLLQKSYAGKVKMIYIDPPYNTGNDFVYPDDYSDNISNYLMITGQTSDQGVKNTTNTESGGRYHSNWLSMMYSRIMVARTLLREDGLMFVSIDDREYERLALLFESLFGEENFVANFVWKKKAGGGDDSGEVAAEHEYVLCYAKNIDRAEISSIRHESPAMTAKYNKKEGGRRYYLERLDKTSLTYSESMDFPIETPDGGFVSPPQADRTNQTTIWRWSKKLVAEKRDDLVFLREKKTNEWRVYTKTWESLNGVTPRSLMVEKHHGRNRDGTQEIDALLKPKVFDFPKPTRMMEHLVSIGAGEKSAVVLDFFAGSGTTGHAVLAKNATDGGDRRYILVQLPEPLDPENKEQKTGADFCDSIGRPRNIAELTKARLRRAAAKLKPENSASPFDGGFRVYKLATSNLKTWGATDDLEADLLAAADNLVDGRTEDDLLVELLLKQGIDLTEPVVTKSLAGRTVHAFGGGVLVVCLGDVSAADAEALADAMADWIGSLAPVAPTTVFFKDAGFENDQAKTNVAAVLEQRLGDQLLKVRSV